MKLYQKLVFICLMGFSLCSFAGVSSGQVNISYVEVTDSFFTLYFGKGITHENCQEGSKVVFWREDYPNGYDSMLSTALAAHMAQKKIHMWVHSCKLGPWGKTLPKAQSVVIY